MGKKKRKSNFIPDDGKTRELTIEADEEKGCDAFTIKCRVASPPMVAEMNMGWKSIHDLISECLFDWSIKEWNEKKNKETKVPITPDNIREMASVTQFLKLVEAITPDNEEKEEEEIKNSSAE